MADNQSISYNRDRTAARRWLEHTKDGQFAVEKMRQHFKGNLGDFLGDNEISWSDMVEEQREGLAIAQSCSEAREAFNLARQSKSTMGVPPGLGNGAHFVKFFTPPLWYVLRRQVEVNDPEYWNYPLNVLREALSNPEWATVSAEYIRGELEKHLPKGRGRTALPEAISEPIIVAPADAT